MSSYETFYCASADVAFQKNLQESAQNSIQLDKFNLKIQFAMESKLLNPDDIQKLTAAAIIVPPVNKGSMFHLTPEINMATKKNYLQNFLKNSKRKICRSYKSFGYII